MTIDTHTRDALFESLLTPMRACERWCPGERLRRGAGLHLDEHLARLHDDAWNTRYHEAIRIGTPADYRHRLVETSSGLAFCSIHFFNGERDRPFVELMARTGAMSWGEALRAALDEHAVFDPGSVRVLVGGDTVPDVGAGWSVTPDLRLVVGTWRWMSEGVTPGITLVDAEPDEAERVMNDGYAAFRRASPDLADRVPAATRQQLEDCPRNGRLVFWMIDGERAGLLGVERAREHALEGWLVTEEVVLPRFSGRGTAALAQRALAGMMVDAGHAEDLVFGTIDASNHASLRTAQRVGREVVASWWFVSPGC